MAEQENVAAETVETTAAETGAQAGAAELPQAVLDVVANADERDGVAPAPESAPEPEPAPERPAPRVDPAALERAQKALREEGLYTDAEIEALDESSTLARGLRLAHRKEKTDRGFEELRTKVAKLGDAQTPQEPTGQPPATPPAPAQGQEGDLSAKFERLRETFGDDAKILEDLLQPQTSQVEKLQSELAEMREREQARMSAAEQHRQQEGERIAEAERARLGEMFPEIVANDEVWEPVAEKAMVLWETGVFTSPEQVFNAASSLMGMDPTGSSQPANDESEAKRDKAIRGAESGSIRSSQRAAPPRPATAEDAWMQAYRVQQNGGSVKDMARAARLAGQ